MNQKIKILIAIDWYRPAHKAGGPITSIENLVNLLGDEPQLQFYIICSAFDYGELQPLNVPQETWLTVGKAQVQYWHPKKLGWKQWMHILQQLKPDIIHTQGLWSPKFSILPLLAAQRYKKAKIVVSPRGMLTPQALKQKGWIKLAVASVLKALNAYKNVVFHSTNDQETQEIQRFLKQAKMNTQEAGEGNGSNNRIQQMPNVPRNLGVAVAQARAQLLAQAQTQLPAQLLPQAGLQLLPQQRKPAHELHWLFVGRISPEKNPLLLLKALQLLPMSTRGYFIGGCKSDAYLQLFQEHINALPKQHHVEYMGEQPLEKITNFLSNAHVLINTSISENFGHAMAEALSAGVPIIVGPNTPWQNLWNEQAGVVAHYSAQGFADAMQAMAALDVAAHQAFKMGAVKRFATQCELSKTKAKYLNLYSLPNP
jgi:glycosyltransferase involved in cell wall biosynthesis